MTNSVSKETVNFEYNNEQGKFRIQYRSNGYASLDSYCMPEGAVWEEGDPVEVQNWGNVETWSHSDPLKEDIEQLSPEDVIAKYQRLFLERDIKETCLETPEEEAIPRAIVAVTCRDGQEMHVVFRADGRGYIIGKTGWTTWDNNGRKEFSGPAPWSPFSHDLPKEEITADWKAITDGLSDEDDGDLDQKYSDKFWYEINPSLEHPYIHDEEDLADSDLTIENCSYEELASLLEDAGMVDDAAWASGEEILTLVGRSATETDASCVDRDDEDNDKFSDRTIKLVEEILTWANPRGFSVEYNDGSRIDWSGYSKYAQTIEAEIAAPSATERLEALERLVNWSEKNGINIEQYLPK